MKRLLLILCIPLLSAASTDVQVPTIAVEPTLTVEKGDFVVIHAITTGKNVKWINPNPALHLLPPEIVTQTQNLVLMPKSAGVYRVYAYTSLNDVLSEPAVCTITVTDSAPPSPSPPSPSPPSTDGWVIVVTDISQPISPAQQRVIDDKALWSSIEAKGGMTLIVDKASKEAATGQYGKYVTTYPALLFLQSDGSYIKTIPLPSTSEEVKKLTE